ncbi:hypothetical protein CR513_28465, partial [Mucuna pruriens]
MCQPGVSFLKREAFILHRTWLVFQSSGHAPTQDHDSAATSAETASVKRCVCSPSQHPGSFRCRLHHGEYVWRVHNCCIRMTLSNETNMMALHVAFHRP